jgi:hypothetical protein
MVTDRCFRLLRFGLISRCVCSEPAHLTRSMRRLRALRDEHMSRRRDNSLKLLSLIWLALWMETWNLTVS